MNYVPETAATTFVLSSVCFHGSTHALHTDPFFELIVGVLKTPCPHVSFRHFVDWSELMK